MRHVRQQNTNDCGIAAAASICDTSYNTAWDHDPNPETSRGFSVPEMLELLRRLSGDRWKAVKPKPVSVATAAPPERGAPEVWLIRKKGDRFGHWVSATCGRIYDPELEFPDTQRLYHRRRWLLIRRVVRA